MSYAAKQMDLVTIEGYKGFLTADINGMNVVLFEEGVYRLYFCNFRERGFVWRASSEDGKQYAYDGIALKSMSFANDVKKFGVGGTPWYLMALHRNTDRLWYSIAKGDGLSFVKEQLLMKNQGASDRYIVAVGLVADATSVYGFLYGASPTRSLNTNKIFAQWLQKRVEFVGKDGGVTTCTAAHGPDRARMPLPNGTATGHFRVRAEDGETLLYTGPEVTIKAGDVWQVSGK